MRPVAGLPPGFHLGFRVWLVIECLIAIALAMLLLAVVLAVPASEERQRRGDGS